MQRRGGPLGGDQREEVEKIRCFRPRIRTKSKKRFTRRGGSGSETSVLAGVINGIEFTKGSSTL